MQNTRTQNVTGKVLMELSEQEAGQIKKLRAIPGGILIAASEKEASLIDKLRLFVFGKALVYKENGQPVRIEEIRENIKL